MLSTAVVSMVVLICGVLASLALGVWIAYGMCIAAFRLLEMHARRLVATEPAGRRAPQRLGTLGN